MVAFHLERWALDQTPDGARGGSTVANKMREDVGEPRSLFGQRQMVFGRSDVGAQSSLLDLKRVFHDKRQDAGQRNEGAGGVLERCECDGTECVQDVRRIEVIAPHFSQRQSGVTATLERVLPIQAKQLRIAAIGSQLPARIPRMRALDLLKLRSRPVSGRDRIWHARRNVEMLVGIVLRDVFRFPLRLVFTSASQRKHTRWTRLLIDRMDSLIATSAATAGYLAHSAAVVPHGIDSVSFSPPADKMSVRRALGLPDLKLVGCFGRIRPSKGSDVFVDAMLPILASRPDTGAVLLGCTTSRYSDYLKNLKEKIDATGLGDRFLVIPEVTTSEMPNWYRALDLYVAPQRWEGFGVTPLEAMASGVPVVATRVGAFQDILTPETGVLVEPGDPAGMSEAISTLLADPQRLSEMATASRERVIRQFSIEEEARRINDVYLKTWEEADRGSRLRTS